MNRSIDRPARGASLVALENEVSRRAFLGRLLKGTAMATSVAAISPKLWALDKATPEQRALALRIFSAIGRITIPEDQDPGWASFEPDITTYAFDVYMSQIFLNGNKDALDGIIQAINHLNDVPVLLNYNVAFLDMSLNSQEKYLSDILTGQFENDGWEDVLGLGASLAVLSAKLTFFSNFPRHLSVRGAEYQILPASKIKSGWDIMGYKGPVGPAEETALRAKFKDVQELPGIDLRNPYI